MNRTCQEAIEGLGANKTKVAITRIGKSIGPLINILDTFDDINGVRKEIHHHSKPSCDKDIDKIMVVKQLTTKAVFKCVPRRNGHASFKKLKQPILSTLNKDNFKKWMIKRIKSINLSPLLV